MTPAHLLYMLALVGVGVANQSTGWAVWPVVAYGLGLFVASRTRLSVGKTSEAVFAVVAVAAAYGVTVARGDTAVLALQYWLVFMVVIRGWRIMERRDHAFCLLISAALYAHIGRNYSDVPFLFLTLGFVALAPAAFFVFMVRYGQFLPAGIPESQLAALSVRRRIGFLAMTSVALLAATAAMFLVIPRPRDTGLLGGGDGGTQLTGFSGNVPLGSFRRLIGRRTVVMTVDTDKPALWRGAPLDYYENGVWYETTRYEAFSVDRLPAVPPGVPTTSRRFEVFDVRLTGNCLFSAGHVLNYFLFKSKQGHCEYFATAMVMLLRCANVPTRAVQGFRQGIRVQDKYVVRLKDAHMWVEVFYPGRGWRAYDPTPGGSGGVDGNMGFLEDMQLKWETYVLQYDRATQFGVMDSLKNAVAGMTRAATHGGISGGAFRPVVVAAVVLLCVLFVLRLVRRRGGMSWWTPDRRKAGRMAGYFGQYLRLLARKGYRRKPGTTPNDLLDALERDGVPVLEEAKGLTKCFYDTRFGGVDLSPESSEVARKALKRIRAWAG